MLWDIMRTRQLYRLMAPITRTGSFFIYRPAISWTNADSPSVGTIKNHYSDVIMGTMVSQIISLTIVYSTVYPGADQRKHQSSASLVFVRGIHRWPVNSPDKGPVTRKMFPFDDIIMQLRWNSNTKIVLKMHFKMPSAIWYSCCLGLDVLEMDLNRRSAHHVDNWKIEG